MALQKFEELIAWQKSQDLAILVYHAIEAKNDFSFKDQICRAVISISNNIAEGFERTSQKEFIRYLNIASSSCGEVRSMIYLSQRLGYTDHIKTQNLLKKTIECGKVISGLSKSVKSKLTF